MALDDLSEDVQKHVFRTRSEFRSRRVAVRPVNFGKAIRTVATDLQIAESWFLETYTEVYDLESEERFEWDDVETESPEEVLVALHVASWNRTLDRMNQRVPDWEMSPSHSEIMEIALLDDKRSSWRGSRTPTWEMIYVEMYRCVHVGIREDRDVSTVTPLGMNLHTLLWRWLPDSDEGMIVRAVQGRSESDDEGSEASEESAGWDDEDVERVGSQTPEDSALWLIEQLVDEARLNGQALTVQERNLLRTPIWDLTDDIRPMGLSLNNRLVPLVRRRIERSKAAGGPTVSVRRGLAVPVDWNDHYSRVYSSELPWFISGIMQNAFLINAPAGEKKPWKSK